MRAEHRLGSLFVAAVAAVVLPAEAQVRSALFIGNSYVTTNDLPDMLRQVALSLGDTLEVFAVAPGGYTFQQHSSLPATLQAIDQQAWDFVVLQEQSQIPSFAPEYVAENCFPYAQELVERIRSNDGCTLPVFYMTWGRENGDAGNCAAWPPVCTYAGMQGLLRERYLQMAVDNTSACAPVGVVWEDVRSAYPEMDLYVDDGSHPTGTGTYLIACTFYATLYRRSPEGAWKPPGVDDLTAARLQTMAATEVLDSLAVWNIDVLDPNATFTWTDQGGGLVQFQAGATEGQHLWIFGEEGGSGLANPDHVFTAPGPHTVLHSVTDACGRVDSASMEVNVIGTGLADGTERSPYEVIATAEGSLLVKGGGRGERLFLHDRLGRDLGTTVLGSDIVRLPALRHPGLWRIIANDGSVHTGKVKVGAPR